MPNFNGTSGNDIWTGGLEAEIAYGEGGNDSLSGSGGDDSLIGGDGADEVNGGDGNDVLISGSPGNPDWIGDYNYLSQVIASLDIGTEVDTLIGGDGDDRIWIGYGDNADGGANYHQGDYLSVSFLGAPSGVTFDGRLATQTIGGGVIQGFEHFDWIQGSNYNDTITGGDSGNGYAHYSTILGMGGNDTLLAGYYTRELDGGDGDDIVDGRGSQYIHGIRGGAGNDILYAPFNGSSVCYGGAGNDTIYGDEFSYGGAGNDTIYIQMGSGPGTGFGDDGDDVIVGNEVNNLIAGGSGADQLDGGAGDDVLQSVGDPVNNYAIVNDIGTEHDSISGGAGNDTIVIGYGDDADGGSGTDRLILSLTGATAGVVMDLSQLSIGSAVVGGGVIANIEVIQEIIATDFADQLTLGILNELIIVTALGGNDTVTTGGSSARVFAGDGDDRIISGIAADLIIGGAGRDTIDYQAYTAGVTVDLQAGTGGGGDTIEQVEDVGGSQFVDILRGDGSANALSGIGGNDTLEGRGGDDLLDGGAGDDSLDGGDGDDDLSAGAGNDIVLGGAGNDRLIGNTGTDTLTGGSGNDTFYDLAGTLSGDTITDLSAGDRIHFNDASLATFTFSLTGNTLIYAGGSVTLQGSINGTLVASAAAEGGVQLTVVPDDVAYDFNGDGRSDILWRSSTGQMSDWLANANGLGGFTGNDANAFTTVSTAWTIAGTGDFNGDGKDDLLWRNNATGQVSDWLANSNGNGGFTPNDANAFSNAPVSWTIAGTGDFNGDGKDDLLWRNNATGQLSNWLANANGLGGFTANDANAFTTVSTAWAIAGTGDFNGDGKDDLLWRNNATGQLSNWLANSNGNGGFTPNDANAFSNAPLSWSIVGVGDFNGDNHDDILWRNPATGQVSNWLANSNGNGGFTANDANAFANAPTNWHIAAIGDYNGDNRDDILWRSDTGQLSNWLANASGNGGFAANDANALTSAPTNWLVQAPDTLWL